MMFHLSSNKSQIEDGLTDNQSDWCQQLSDEGSQDQGSSFGFFLEVVIVPIVGTMGVVGNEIMN